MSFARQVLPFTEAGAKVAPCLAAVFDDGSRHLGESFLLLTVKQRSSLNHRLFPTPPVLTAVISRSFPRRVILMPAATAIAF